MTNLIAGQKFTHQGKTYTFRGFWFSNVSKQTYAMARSVSGGSFNIPVSEIEVGA